MKIVYIAYDGTEFSDQWECEDYEWRQLHSFDDIIFYDGKGNPLTDVLSEETYNNVAKVIVKTDEAVRILHDLADYTGFCCYESIDSVGTWTFKDGEFYKEEENA